jgi:hypothetical protein
MGFNEYQPGALWFFVFVGWLSLNPVYFEVYLTTLIFINVALIIGCFGFFERFGHRYSTLIFIGVLLATGPIIFYRFELLVGLLTLFAWLLFKKNHYLWSALLLGVSIAIKLYPVILLPLLMLELIRKRKYVFSLVTAIIAGLGAAIPVGAFFLMGGSVEGSLVSLSIHKLKPVNPEGFWGSVIMLWQKIIGVPIQASGAYAIHGFIPHVPFLTSDALNWVWVFTSGLLGLAIMLLFWRRGYKNPALFFVSLLAFVLFSKVLNPQYLWWFVIFYPLIPFSFYRNKVLAWLSLVIMLSALFITQFVYPIHYTDFLLWFSNQATDPTIFVISVARNVLFMLLLIIFLANLFNTSSKTFPENISTFFAKRKRS